VNINKNRLHQIIREEFSGALQEARTTMRAQRAAAAERLRARGALETVGELDDDPGADGRAYIDQGFQAETGIGSVEDLAAAAESGSVDVWSYFMLGGAMPTTYTVVPKGASPFNDPDTGGKGYPYVVVKPKRFLPGGERELQTVVQRGTGGGSPPRVIDPSSIMAMITDVVPVDLGAGSAGKMMGGGLAESTVRRWNLLAGTSRK